MTSVTTAQGAMAFTNDADMYTGIFADTREVFLGWIGANFKLDTISTPVLTVNMPCGETLVCETFADIPMHSLHCACGDARHWFIKYRDEDLATV